MTSEVERQLVAKKPLSQQLHADQTSALKRYQGKAVGDARLSALIRYELVTILFGNLSGAPGYFLRKLFYPAIFRRLGRGAIIGKGVVLRYPGRIDVGDHLSLDDYVLLDASGAGEEGIRLGNDVIVSRNCVVQGKTGSVWIGDKTDIGVNTVISSASGVSIGHSVLIAGNCYIGGGRYISDRLDIPMMEQGSYSNGPVRIGDDVWLGAGAIVLDGVSVGKGTIVGAGAVVAKDLPEFSVAVGVPARVVKSRV